MRLQVVSCLLAAVAVPVSVAAAAHAEQPRQRRQNDDNEPALPPTAPPPPPIPEVKNPFPSFGGGSPPKNEEEEQSRFAADITTLDTLAKLVAGMPEFSVLTTALAKADLLDQLLTGPGPFTLFAPTNAAFEAMPPATLARLLGNKRMLKEVLERHILGENLEEKHLAHGYTPLSPLGGEELAIILTDDGRGELRSGYAQASVIQFDILASNGVLHVIDTVV